MIGLKEIRMKNKAIIIKCTEEEYNLYKMYAELHKKTITSIIKDSFLKQIIIDLKGGENM